MIDLFRKAALAAVLSVIAGTCAALPENQELERKCMDGNASACSAAAELYEQGIRVNRNTSEAARMRVMACKHGDAASCNAVGGVFLQDAVGKADSSSKKLVYREASYWAKYNNSEAMAGILNGRSDARGQPDFKRIFYYYQGTFSANCPKQIPEGSPQIVYSNVTKDKFGNEVSRSHVGTVRIRAEYFEKFQAYGQELAQGVGNVMLPGNNASERLGAILTANPKDLWGKVSSLAQYILDVKKDLDTLFTDNTCESGLQQQFAENLRRLADDEPTLQQDPKVKVNYAARDSSQQSVKKTLTTACYEHYKAAWLKRPYGDFWHQHGDWCRCLDRQFSQSLNTADLRAAIDDFDTFETSVTKTPRSASDPAWRRVETARVCFNR